MHEFLNFVHRFNVQNAHQIETESVHAVPFGPEFQGLILRVIFRVESMSFPQKEPLDGAPDFERRK